jgi:hypothetical protein
MPKDVIAGLLLADATASVALDRGGTTTVSLSNFMPEREDGGGYGCPHCGSELNFMDDEFVKTLIARGYVMCCGYTPGREECARWLRAARLLRERLHPH